MSPPYPFSAVVGLADLRLALLLTAVSPAIGGVLVRGEKGTAKSTVVRALAALLPEVDVVPGCRFACDPADPDPDCPDGPHEPGAAARRRRATLVELPVGATEDRVVGTLDLQRALADGVKAYEPGLLAAAHRGVLYVDEVNLLPDHLVDLLLDAAAMGRAHVERDGVSVKHAARFLLVGTMNPEEGEPRPQLVDRFGLVVAVTAPREAAPRAEVVRRRLAYETDPVAFAARWVDEDAALADRIAVARRRLPRCGCRTPSWTGSRRICLAYGVDGMRADIVVARTAVALAAWHDRDVVTADDVRDAARLALPHRRRRDPLDPPGADQERLEDLLREHGGDADPEPDPPVEPDDDPDGGPSNGPDGGPPDGPTGRPTAGRTRPGPDRVEPARRTGQPAAAGRPGTSRPARTSSPVGAADSAAGRRQPAAGRGDESVPDRAARGARTRRRRRTPVAAPRRTPGGGGWSAPGCRPVG